jgi:hypothetical protein
MKPKRNLTRWQKAALKNLTAADAACLEACQGNRSVRARRCIKEAQFQILDAMTHVESHPKLSR